MNRIRIITSDHQEFLHTQYYISVVSDFEVQTVFCITDIPLRQYLKCKHLEYLQSSSNHTRKQQLRAIFHGQRKCSNNVVMSQQPLHSIEINRARQVIY